MRFPAFRSMRRWEITTPTAAIISSTHMAHSLLRAENFLLPTFTERSVAGDADIRGRRLLQR